MLSNSLSLKYIHMHIMVNAFYIHNHVGYLADIEFYTVSVFLWRETLQGAWFLVPLEISFFLYLLPWFSLPPSSHPFSCSWLPLRLFSRKTSDRVTFLPGYYIHGQCSHIPKVGKNVCGERGILPEQWLTVYMQNGSIIGHCSHESNAAHPQGK